MGPVNWIAVILAANVALAIGFVWNGPLFRTGRPLLEGEGEGRAKGFGKALLVLLIASVMLGHNYARLGVDTLAAKPWLYWMQAGGLAIAFVIPAVWLVSARAGIPARARWIDAGFWLVAYLAMGTTFWALR